MVNILFLFYCDSKLSDYLQVTATSLIDPKKNDTWWQYTSRIVCPTNFLFVDDERLKPLLSESLILFQFGLHNKKLQQFCAEEAKNRNFDTWQQYTSRIVCPTNLLFVNDESLEPQLAESSISFQFRLQNKNLWQFCVVEAKQRNFDIWRQYISRTVCPTNLLFVNDESLKPHLSESSIRF